MDSVWAVKAAMQWWWAGQQPPGPGVRKRRRKCDRGVRSPVEAVRCASEIQTELEVRNADLAEDRRMRFRIGVNLGDVMAGI